MGRQHNTGARAHKQDGRPKAVEPWLRAVVNVETDDCIPFPFQRTRLGYGLYVATTGREDRKKRRANNYVCELAHGPPPSPYHRSAHSCDNPPCVNKRHLRWALPVENTADMLQRDRHSRGERVAHAKLTDELVREVRRRVREGEMQKDVAADLGVAKSVICEIVNRKAWKHVQ